MDATEGHTRKVFSSADFHHGGFIGSSSAQGMSRHIPALVAVSGSGRKPPPFFIIAGKRMLSNWFQLVNGSFHSIDPLCHKFVNSRWFPSDAVCKSHGEWLLGNVSYASCDDTYKPVRSKRFAAGDLISLFP